MNDAELIKIVDDAIANFSGDSNNLGRAIGMLFIGRRYGWRVMYLIHSKATVRKYENILGIKIQDVLPEVGALAKKSIAWNAVQKVSSYWKAVKGEIQGIRTSEVSQ